MDSLIGSLRSKVVSLTLVGSRTTCCPAPTDTDQDVLILITPEQNGLFNELLDQGFGIDGSEVCDPADHLGGKGTFQSFSLRDLNLIITQDAEFHRRFLAATCVAKRLNLMQKNDRIALFQAVLYGNSFVDPVTPELGDFDDFI
jgi:hypothetical protein